MKKNQAIRNSDKFIRTDEEYLELVQRLTLSRAPKQKCEYCGEVYFVEQGELCEENISWSNHITTVSWTTDPFDSEINQDETCHWLCSHCEHDAAMEI